jgi:hypothetical protein
MATKAAADKSTPAYGRLLVPTDSFSLPFQGASYTFVPGDIHSVVEEGHPILEGREHLFKVLIPSFAVDDDQERWQIA